MEPLKLYHYCKARFQIEFLFRDAKQFTGLSNYQARSEAKLDLRRLNRPICLDHFLNLSNSVQIQ